MDESPPPQLHHKIEKEKKKQKQKALSNKQTHSKKLGWRRETWAKCFEFTSIGSSQSYVLQELVKFAIMMNGKYIVWLTLGK